jgi:hypothetical protein
VGSYDISVPEKILFDTTVELQTNQLLKDDFGELYNQKRTGNIKQEKKVDSFTTRNNVRLKAFTTQKSMRGQLTGADRPSLVIYDDFENSITVSSSALTQKIIDTMNETRTGADAKESKIIYLANYLSEQGVVQYFMDLLDRYEKGRLRKVPIVNESLIPAWGSKYTMIGEKDKIKIEDLKSKHGERVFQLEYMLNPQAFVPEKSYYYDLIEELRSKERVQHIPYDESLPTFTWWDLGMSDHMVVLIFQKTQFEWRLIDFIEVSQKSLKDVILDVLSRPYKYVRHYAPHDIRVRELSTGSSRLEIAKEFGIDFEITSNLPVIDGIDAVRRKITSLWVDVKCNKVLNTLARYREWNGKPLHNDSSHVADAMRYWAVTDVDAYSQEISTQYEQKVNNQFQFSRERTNQNFNPFGLD